MLANEWTALMRSGATTADGSRKTGADKTSVTVTPAAKGSASDQSLCFPYLFPVFTWIWISDDDTAKYVEDKLKAHITSSTSFFLGT